MRNVLDRIAQSVWACLATFAVLTAEGSESPQDPVEAVWKTHSLVFHYRNEGRLYSCDVLEHKVEMILRRLGARDRIEVRRVACRDLGGAAQIEVLMESPVIATAENIREITQYNSQDELIARVRGVQLASPEDLQRFPAVWETISFRRDRKLHLDARDCALVQQLRHQILPQMSVQVLRDIDRVDCTQASARLTVQALVATVQK